MDRRIIPRLASGVTIAAAERRIHGARAGRRSNPGPGDLYLADPDGTDVVRLIDSKKRDEYSRSWQALGV